MGKVTHAQSFEQHPVLHQEYGLFTPPIHEFFQTVEEWIDNRVPGGYIFGPSRYGKSRAVRFWAKVLIEERYRKQLPFYRMIYLHHDRVHESEFLTEILAAVKHHYLDNKSRRDKLDRLVNFFCTEARNAGGNHIVFMIDEAQNMRDLEFRWLCNIQNAMDDLGFRFTVTSIGSQELAYQHSLFSEGQDVHLMGRFMVRNARFHGIRSMEELRYVLNGYDQDTEWPEGSGISYTQFFFRRAYDAGFRINEYASTFWELYTHLAPERLRSRLEVPMEHIVKAIEHLFRKFHTTDARLTFKRNELEAAITQTQYQAHMRAVARISIKDINTHR